MRGAAGKRARVADRARGVGRLPLGAPTFVAELQVILNRGGERLIQPPLLPEDVLLQASQDGAYLRIHMNTRPFVTTPSTKHPGFP